MQELAEQKEKERKEAEEKKKDEGEQETPVHWKELVDERIVGQGNHEFDVEGPIQLELNTVSLGHEGLKNVTVDWRPLDEKGNVIPTLGAPRSERPAQKRGIYSFGAFYGVSAPVKIVPPFKSKHGYRVMVSIPPQQTYSSVSTGVALDLMTPQGTKSARRIE